MLHLNDVQKALVELLNDIRAMRVGDSSGALLIVVEDERAATVLRELLSFGSRAVLEANFVRWVGRRRRSHSSGGTVLSAKQHEARLLRDAADRIAAKHGNAEVPSAQDWTVAMGGDMRGAMKPIGANKRFSGDSRFDRRFGHSSKGGERGGRAGDYEGVARRGGSGDCDAGRVASAIGGAGGKRDSELTDSEVTSANISEHLDLLPDVEESTMVCTRGVGAAALLEEIQPKFVILYDADVAFVRAIEVAQASRPAETIQVYFLMQSDSVEEQKYRSALKAETEAFQSLILDKGRMAPPEDWDGRTEQIPRVADHVIGGTARGANAATRCGGGRMAPRTAPTVVVDVREFRSALPNMLHLHGIGVKPVTLEESLSTAAVDCG
mmetsp:Transcript_10121/g.23079  ORF Transcript_10121/g.23079 Transcript_10121/m.23079 type:complete len:382 (-) Transcript_10121:1230-2375(-)